MNYLTHLWRSIADTVADIFFFLSHFFILSLRYKIEVKGAEYLEPQEGQKKSLVNLVFSES